MRWEGLGLRPDQLPNLEGIEGWEKGRFGPTTEGHIDMNEQSLLPPFPPEDITMI